jgi:hypothetical protein
MKGFGSCWWAGTGIVPKIKQGVFKGCVTRFLEMRVGFPIVAGFSIFGDFFESQIISVSMQSLEK